MTLNNIDFSNGIRSQEIQQNFDILHKGLNRERLTVSGYGICSGFDLSMEGFKLHCTEGQLIDKKGELISIKSQSIDIELPNIVQSEENITPDSDGIFYLKHIPYRLDKISAVTSDTLSDIKIKELDTIKEVSIHSCVDNKITVNPLKYSNSKLKVAYNYSGKRLDVVYLDTQHNIKIITGLTSTSPSIMLPVDYSYILCYIEIDAYFQDIDKKSANCMIVKKNIEKRNIYTDENNNLYIGGVPFKKLNMIHYTKPEDPFVGVLWYDIETNKLLIYKTVKGITEWVPVNDFSTHPVTEIMIFRPQDNPEDLQTFYFKNRRMNFIPGNNELSVVIDNIPLHSDQFREVISEDLAAYDDFMNIGCGIRLLHPLDQKSHVEIRATHRIYDSPLKTRFQRTATFVHEDHIIIYDKEVTYNRVFTLQCPQISPYFRYGENQLELYLNGKKLIKTKQFEEIPVRELLLDELPEAGENCNAFIIYSPLRENDFIEYKITTSIYSYDNISKLFEIYNEQIDSINTTLTEIQSNVNDKIVKMEDKLNLFENRIVAMERATANLDTFIRKTDILDISNIPDVIKQSTPKGIINTSFVKTHQLMEVLEITEKDYISAFNINGIAISSVLIKDVDYKIIEDNILGKVYFETLNPGKIEDNTTVYIMGIKF